MLTLNVKINTIEKVKKFVSITTQFPCDVDIGEGRYIIDGKSIMGLFSLDLSKPTVLHIHCEKESDCNKYKEELAEFIIE